MQECPFTHCSNSIWLEGLKSGLQTTLVMFSVTDGSREISTEIMFENTLILQLNIQDKKVSFSNLGLRHPHSNAHPRIRILCIGFLLSSLVYLPICLSHHYSNMFQHSIPIKSIEAVFSHLGVK